jgi:hypothetical protein
MDVSKPGKRFQTEGWSTLINTPRHSRFQNAADTCVRDVGNIKRIRVRGMVVEPTTRRSRIYPGQSRRAQIPIREAGVYNEVNKSVRGWRKSIEHRKNEIEGEMEQFRSYIDVARRREKEEGKGGGKRRREKEEVEEGHRRKEERISGTR